MKKWWITPSFLTLDGRSIIEEPPFDGWETHDEWICVIDKKHYDELLERFNKLEELRVNAYNAYWYF